MTPPRPPSARPALEREILQWVAPAARNELRALLRQREDTFYRQLAGHFGTEAAWVLLPGERRRWRVQGPTASMGLEPLSPLLSEAARQWLDSHEHLRGQHEPAAPDDTPASAEAQPLPALDPALRALLVLRFALNVGEFARRMFPHLIRLPFSPMHRDLLHGHDAAAATFNPARKARRLAIAAPRGSAKSTLLSLILPLHQMLYLRERYIVLISATLPQAERRLAQVRSEVRGNALLARLFPTLCGTARGLQETANLGTLKFGGVRFDARSAGCELRGMADGPWRPTHVLLDDAEPSEVAWSATQRLHIEEWFHDVVEPLGDGYTHLTAAGTLLHPESLLARLIARSDVEGHRYASVLEWSPRDDLWDAWRRLFVEPDGGPDRAEAWLQDHREAMLEGTRVLWPEREDYSALMQQLTVMGRRAFFKEKQNEPRQREGMLFDPATFRMFDVEGEELLLDAPAPRAAGAPTGAPTEPRRVPLRELLMAGFLDATTGAAGPHGDDAAIAVVARCRAGRLYLLHVWMQPAQPTRQIEMLFELHARYGFTRAGFESNCFQGLLRLPIETERQRRRAAGLPHDLPCQPIHHHQAKEQRIAALEPLLTHGMMLVNRAIDPRFLAQAEQYPHAPHDDGLDAVAAAAALARTFPAPGEAAVHRVARQRRGW